MNSYEYVEFQVSMQPIPVDISVPPVYSVEPYESTNFTFTSDHYVVYRIGVAITNSHGTGPEREICVALGEHSEYLSSYISYSFIFVMVSM